MEKKELIVSKGTYIYIETTFITDTKTDIKKSVLDEAMKSLYGVMSDMTQTVANRTSRIYYTATPEFTSVRGDKIQYREYEGIFLSYIEDSKSEAWILLDNSINPRRAYLYDIKLLKE